MEREPVSKFSQLKAMISRNILLKKRAGRKTIAVSWIFELPYSFTIISIAIYQKFVAETGWLFSLLPVSELLYFGWIASPLVPQNISELPKCTVIILNRKKKASFRLSAVHSKDDNLFSISYSFEFTFFCQLGMPYAYLVLGFFGAFKITATRSEFRPHCYGTCRYADRTWFRNKPIKR